jgi:hypothetical protein
MALLEEISVTKQRMSAEVRFYRAISNGGIQIVNLEVKSTVGHTGMKPLMICH